VSVYSAQANQIAGLLLVFAVVAIGGCKAFHTAWAARRTDPVARKHITQRNRYVLVGFGLLCSAPMIYMFVHFGVGNVFQVLGLTIDASPSYGWATSILAVFGAISPIVGLIVALRVKLRPSPFAYRKGDTYVPTVLKRDGKLVQVPWLRTEHVRTDRFGTTHHELTGGNADHYDTVLYPR
jgi:hypothetical protein